ncbi:MAG: FAD:protein FMN transferase [Myxococcales bacterium]|nr:FAD:protein FMN transferase [Myxococcales bacterium]
MADPRPARDPASPLGPRPWRRFLPPALFLIVVIVGWLWRQPDARVLSTFRGQAQGTTWVVKIVTPAPLTGDQNVAAGRLIDREIQAIDVAMSTWRKDSEISRFNALQATTPFPASEGFRTVVALAEDVSKASGGVFDVTVGPLVEAWGFGPDGVQRIPDEPTLAAIRERVGYQRLHIEGEALRKEVAAAHVDLSAIAQGYTVDRILEALVAAGYTDLFVEVGGETRARGQSEAGRPWQVGIERPLADEQTVHRIVPLVDTSLATSGDYRRYREQDGQRVSHTIDPRTGRPIRHHLASVTVLHARCALADAWATALNVLGPDEGYALAERLGLAALFLVRDPAGGWQEKATPAFEAVAGQQPR